MGKFYEAIMGLVVGDALGVPYEFRNRDTFKATGMTGFGTYSQPPGTWSDDSSMTLATVESLCVKKGVVLTDIMTNFVQWFYNRHFTPHGTVFDVGLATRNAILKFAKGASVEECGGTSEHDNGNGALMRILPMAFYPGSLADVVKVASLTHNHQISNAACAIYVAVARGLQAGRNKQQAIREGFEQIQRAMDIPDNFSRVPALDGLTRDEIGSTGFVVDTLEAALWCLLKADSYRETVLMAVNLGGDTDTTAAVAGGLAGILYGIGGEKGIPVEWIAQIAKVNNIIQLCKAFEDRFELDRGNS